MKAARWAGGYMVVDVVALPAARYLPLPVVTTQTNQPTKILLLLKKEGKEEDTECKQVD